MPRPPRHTCDAPGCSAERKPKQLMCRPCWFRTPKPLRDAISVSWREGRIREWSANCLEARRWHRDNPIGSLAARICGERPSEAEAA